MRATIVVLVWHLVSAHFNYEQLWAHFKEKHKRIYNETEAHVRFQIFKANVDLIHSENGKRNTFSVAINKFADLTNEEFRTRYFGLRLNAPKLELSTPILKKRTYSGAVLPSEVDHSTVSVTEVKNQKQCGSCYAFAAAGALESRHHIVSGKKLLSLSEQQFVDCTDDQGNDGCNGGLMDNCYEYAKYHDVCGEADYPYKNKRHSCEIKSCDHGIKKGLVSGIERVDANESALMEAVAEGPVSVGIQADQSSFMFYDHGVVTEKCGQSLNHAVLIVGYGKEDGVKYWLIRNSWGANWGLQGYAKILRSDDETGMCGILSLASYPVIRSDIVV